VQTATNPQTGEKVQWNGSAWVPLGGASPAPAPAAGGPITLGTPKPAKPEVRQVGKQLGLVDPNTGSFTPTYTAPGDASGEGGKLTEGERKGGAFLKRALGSYQTYERLGVGPRSVPNNIVNEISPTLANTLPSALGGNDPARQQASAAENEFLTAILRQDSGATITPDELESQRRIYFPQPGETAPEVLEAKRQARLRAIRGLIGASGGGADPETLAAAEALLNPPEEQLDTTERPIFEPSQGGVEVATGDTRIEDNPALAGVNARINQMLKSGSKPGEFVAFFQSVGIPPREMMPQVLQALKFRKEKGYAGDFSVNVDDIAVPNSAFNQLAASPAGAYAVAAGDTVTGGHLDNLVGATGGNAELAYIGIQQTREMHPGASLLGDVTGGAALYASGAGALRAAGVPAAQGAVRALAPRALAGDAALGGYVASGQGGTQAADVGNVVAGAALGVGTGAAVRGGFNTVGAAVSPTGGRLAPVMEAGARPTVGQRLQASDNGLLRKIGAAEEVFSRFPILGASQRSGRNAAMDEMQRGAFNEALKEIGVQLPKGVKKGTQAHSIMQRSFDQAYDRARRGMQFGADQQWADDLTTLQQDVQLLSKDSQNAYKQMLMLVGGKLSASPGQVLSGDQYKIVVSKLAKKVGALRSNPNGDTELADVLESLKGAIDDAARRHSDPKAVEFLDAADRGYAKAVVIENAARMRGGDAGEFNGSQLSSSVQRTNKSRRSRAYLRGEAVMQDYAESAKALGDFVPNSGSPEQLMTMTAGGAALGISPTVLAPWAVTGVPTLPGVRQTLGTLMAPRPEHLRGGFDRARNLIELLGRYGAPVAIPSASTE
jgi:hypothetical protein